MNNCATKFLISTCLALLVSFGTLAEVEENVPVKFAFYSAAWGENANSGLRLVVENQQEVPIVLQSIAFPDAEEPARAIEIRLDLNVPARGFAEQELPYADLLSRNECVITTLRENWKLVEISNYTLNPSVRRLIIEDTNAFRIYQCITTARTQWLDVEKNELHDYQEWILYHFESRVDR
jgi:hypothetical protein